MFFSLLFFLRIHGRWSCRDSYHTTIYVSLCYWLYSVFFSIIKSFSYFACTLESTSYPNMRSIQHHACVFNARFGFPRRSSAEFWWTHRFQTLSSCTIRQVWYERFNALKGRYIYWVWKGRGFEGSIWHSLYPKRTWSYSFIWLS